MFTEQARNRGRSRIRLAGSELEAGLRPRHTYAPPSYVAGPK
jgi:hypothetical protein